MSPAAWILGLIIIRLEHLYGRRLIELDTIHMRERLTQLAHLHHVVLVLVEARKDFLRFGRHFGVRA